VITFPLHDCAQLQTGNGRNDWGMEDPPREAEADKSNVNHLLRPKSSLNAFRPNKTHRRWQGVRFAKLAFNLYPLPSPPPPFFRQNTSFKGLNVTFHRFSRFCTQYLVFQKCEIPTSCLLLLGNHPFLRCSTHPHRRDLTPMQRSRRALGSILSLAN